MFAISNISLSNIIANEFAAENAAQNKNKIITKLSEMRKRINFH